MYMIHKYIYLCVYVFMLYIPTHRSSFYACNDAYTYVNIYTYICQYIHAYMYVYICVYICIYMYIYMYICIHLGSNSGV